MEELEAILPNLLEAIGKYAMSDRTYIFDLEMEDKKEFVIRIVSRLNFKRLNISKKSAIERTENPPE